MNRLFFWAALGLQKILGEKYGAPICPPCLPRCPAVDILRWCVDSLQSMSQYTHTAFSWSPSSVRAHFCFVHSMGFDKRTMTSIHHCGTTVALPKSSRPFLPPPRPLVTTNIFTVSMVVPFPERHVTITWYGAFSDWLPSLSNMYSGFLLVLQ